LEDDLSRKR